MIAATLTALTENRNTRAAPARWRESRYVLNYSSRISPGIFRDPNFGDVAPLSHELSETFNDPFVNNATPYSTAEQHK